ncbi:MAG TPA: RHS repeat-associated core domain-containing protein, partial [Pirellulaceae bacterium]|nr:RHS repeat-associated core domain-containing protein [Pirellulaceae bacterium]HMO94451.1 RHS repeat-associated core domain-containing protein [Pirellulaceae bacterium]
STTALTNNSGLVVERYAYTAYGQLKVMTHTGGVKSWTDNSNRYLYTGREWDNGTQLYHFRARQYSPHLGRFVSRDTLGYVDGMSSYAGYFAVRGLDPFGLQDGGRVRVQIEAMPIDPVPGANTNKVSAWGVIQQNNKCRIGLDCVNILGRMGVHCGIIMENHSGTSNANTTILHAWGWYHPGGNSCKVSTGRSPGAKPSSYYQHWLGAFDQSVCDCIVNKVASFNNFIESFEYQLSPRNTCMSVFKGSIVTKSTCNSNYSAHCLLRGCGLGIEWSSPPIGWNHRIEKCVEVYPQISVPDVLTVTPCCNCKRWEVIDEHVCGLTE